MLRNFSDRDSGSRGGYPQSGDREGNSRGYPQSGDRDGGSRNFSDRDGGSRNFGDRDGGSRNFGGRDGGSRNFGDRDGGSRNFGDRDGGSRNFGDRDGGSRNFGDRDGGSRNFGDRDGGSRNFADRDGGSRGFPPSGDREGGSRDNLQSAEGGSKGFGDRVGGWGADRENRSGGDEGYNRRHTGGSSFGQSSSRSNNYSRPQAEERPAHLRLNILPKGSTIPSDNANVPAIAEKPVGKSGDKWSTIFKNSDEPPAESSSGQDARSERINDGPARVSNDNVRERRDFRDSDRGDRPERSMGSYGDRSGNSGSYRGGRGDSRGDDVVIDDPRFAGKFGSSSAGSSGASYGRGDARGSFGGDRGGDSRPGRYEGGGGGGIFGGGGRYEGGGRYGDRYPDSVAYDPSAPLPTAPRSQMSSAPPPPPILSTGPSPVALKAAEDAKAAKAAKKLEREEAERRAKEAKEAAASAAAAALEKKKTDHAIALAAASDALATGLTGNALLSHINGIDPKPSAGALLKEILSKHDISEVSSWKWFKKDQYGDVLVALVAGSVPSQVAVLFSVQEYCFERKFPKVEIDGKTRKLIELLFTLLLTSNIVDPEGYIAWIDDDDAADMPGRTDAVVQIGPFIQTVRESLIDEFDEEEDEEIDAPRECIVNVR